MNKHDTEKLVRAIVERAGPELRRRRDAQRFGSRLFRDVQRRTVPLAAAAATVALISTMALAWFGLSVDQAEAQVPVLATAIAPEAYAEWMISGENPAVSSLILDLDEGDPQ